MKKLISLMMAFVLMLAIVGCACNSTSSAQTARGELSVAYDKAGAGDLLAYFQANQGVVVTGVQLDEKTDYAKLSKTASVALIKDEAVAEKLKAAGWTETQDWTEAQKAANESTFNFTVLIAPDASDSSKTAAKILTGWLAGDATYDTKISTMSGGCSCQRTETTVTITSDAPELFKTDLFDDLKS